MPEGGDDVVYTRRGTPYECMKKGIGAGAAIERKKKLSPRSLQHIKYIGDVYERRFKKYAQITNLDDLIDSPPTATQLAKIVTKKGGRVDPRAFNSVVMYLYSHNPSYRRGEIDPIECLDVPETL